MEAYAKQLEKDTSREKEQQDRKIEQLNKRKEDMVKEKKQKMNVSGVYLRFSRNYTFMKHPLYLTLSNIFEKMFKYLLKCTSIEFIFWMK